METNGKRILLIDDQQIVSDAFSRTLTTLGGFNVTIINKVDEILSHLENTERYDLILLDLMMENTDGFEVLQSLRANEEKYRIVGVPIVILTNVSSDEARQKAQSLNVAGYFVKTDYPGRKLIEAVAKIMTTGNENTA